MYYYYYYYHILKIIQISLSKKEKIYPYMHCCYVGWNKFDFTAWAKSKYYWWLSSLHHIPRFIAMLTSWNILYRPVLKINEKKILLVLQIDNNGIQIILLFALRDMCCSLLVGETYNTSHSRVMVLSFLNMFGYFLLLYRYKRCWNHIEFIEWSTLVQHAIIYGNKCVHTKLRP